MNGEIEKKGEQRIISKGNEIIVEIIKVRVKQRRYRTGQEKKKQTWKDKAECQC